LPPVIGLPDGFQPGGIAFVAARVDRQAILDTDRPIVAVLTEGALRWHVGFPQIMAAQMEDVS
jgi:hypothetical protein